LALGDGIVFAEMMPRMLRVTSPRRRFAIWAIPSLRKTVQHRRAHCTTRRR